MATTTLRLLLLLMTIWPACAGSTMKTGRPSSGTQLLAGYLALFGSIVTSVFSASCVQALRGAVPDFQLSAIRSLGQCLCYIIGGLLVGTTFKVGRVYVPWLIYYGALFLLNNIGFYGAATYLPLSEVQGLVTMVSFVFTLAQCKLLFNNNIAKSVIIAAIVCVVGIVLVAQPAWMFKKMLHTSDPVTACIGNASSTQALNASSNYGYSVSSGKVMLGYGLTIFGGAGLGLGYDLNGIILCDVNIFPKATYATLVSTVGSIAFMFYLEEPVYVIDFIQFIFIVGHSLLSAITSFLTMYASSNVSGSSVSILYSLEVITMLISQYTLMHSINPGNYNWIEVCGCTIILFGASIPGVIDILAHKAKANELP